MLLRKLASGWAIMGCLTAILELGLLLQGQSLTLSSTEAIRSRELAERQLARERSVRVELAKPLEAKKVKPGDRILAELMEPLAFDDAVLAPRGAKIQGRVVAIQRVEGNSALILTFEHAIVKGTRVPLTVAVKAIGIPLVIDSAHWVSRPGTPPVDSKALSIHGRLPDNAQGVWGLPGLTLEEAGPDASRLRYKDADLILPSRTQMILRVTRK
jgi:hypothetical protein